MSCSSPAARTSEVTDHLVVVLKITLSGGVRRIEP